MEFVRGGGAIKRVFEVEEGVPIDEHLAGRIGLPESAGVTFVRHGKQGFGPEKRLDRNGGDDDPSRSADKPGWNEDMA